MYVHFGSAIFAWDDRKNQSTCGSIRLGSISPARFSKILWLLSTTESEGEEKRWQVIGRARNRSLLFVICTFRKENDDEIIRIISARRATPREREIYEERS